MMFPSDLTLRDYIAVHAMQGLMTMHPEELAKMQRHEIDMNLSALVARIAYKVADQMMKERENDQAQSGQTQGIEEQSSDYFSEDES